MIDEMMSQPIFRALLLLLLGASCVLGFAPFYVYPVSLVSLICLCLMLGDCKTSRSASWTGFLFGLGLFGVGIYWIYISLHDFGGMPIWMASFATFVLAAFMASFTGLTTGLSFWLTQQKNTPPFINYSMFIIALATFWGLTDWTRSWIFTGFPWLTIGYSQVPNSPLIGFMPILGVYGITTITVLLAGLIATYIRHVLLAKRFSNKASFTPIILSACIITMGFMLGKVQWTQATGKPISTALIQGNIAQDLKWSPDITLHTIELYLEMIKQSDAQLIVLPETAFPILSTQLDATLKNQLINQAKKVNGNILLGIVDYQANQQTYLNAALTFGVAPTQYYAKNHLVPFGEFIPFKQIFGWIYRDYLNMPMSDMSRGGTDQQPLTLSNQKVAVNICYEDVFGEEIIRQLPNATLLVNITNDAWYGHSFAADQHMQFSQARAIETGRMMLRATNTGATAAIHPDGHVIAHAPHFTQTTLNVMAQGYSGTTPYVLYGNWLFLWVSLTLLGLLSYRKFRFKSS